MSRDRFSLQGRRALVTGATRGLGSQIATALAEAGAHVIINGRSHETVTRTAESLRRRGYLASECAFDVANERQLVDALSAIRARPDIVVSNVGIRHRATLDQIELKDFQHLIEVNLTSMFSLTKATIPSMQQQGWGRIIAVTSIAGALARVGDAAYTSAKGGLASLMRALAVELAPQGITCNAIAPGFFLTESNTEFAANGSVNAYVQARVPMRRWGDPSEIAGAAVFLASPAASYVNGHVLVVDGGLSAAF